MLFSALLNGEHDDIFKSAGHTYDKNKCVIFIPITLNRVYHHKANVYCIMHKKGDDHITMLIEPCARKTFLINEEIDITVRYT